MSAPKTLLKIGLPVVQLTFCFMVTVSGWAATLPLDLNETIQLALKNNPRIDIARQQYFAGEGLLTQAKSLYFPHLMAGADYGRMNIDNIQPVDEDNFGRGLLKASQLIWDFGRTTGLIDANKFNLGAATENLKQITQDVVFEVKNNFYSVLEKKRLITVADQAVKNYEQQLYRARRYYEAGVRARIDVTNASVNLSNQKLNLLRANSNYKAARLRLEKVLGSSPNEGDYQLVSNEPALEALAAGKPEMPTSLENLLTAAEENRPGLKQYTFLVQTADSVLSQAQGDYWPSIKAIGDYNGYETDLSTLTDQWQVSVGLTWEFFSGFETDGKVAEANARLREVKAAMRDFELLITQDVTESLLRADENREGVDIADQTLVLARENLNLAEGRYKAGLGDLLEFNDAQLLFTENQASLVITYYSYLIALARIERAIGVVPELVNYDVLNTDQEKSN